MSTQLIRHGALPPLDLDLSFSHSFCSVSPLSGVGAVEGKLDQRVDAASSCLQNLCATRNCLNGQAKKGLVARVSEEIQAARVLEKIGRTRVREGKVQAPVASETVNQEVADLASNLSDVDATRDLSPMISVNLEVDQRSESSGDRESPLEESSTRPSGNYLEPTCNQDPGAIVFSLDTLSRPSIRIRKFGMIPISDSENGRSNPNCNK